MTEAILKIDADIKALEELQLAGKEQEGSIAFNIFQDLLNKNKALRVTLELLLEVQKKTMDGTNIHGITTKALAFKINEISEILGVEEKK